MKFPHKPDRIEIEVFHRLPAQDRVKMRVRQREFMRGGTDRAENFEKINLMKRDGLLPVKRLQRANRRMEPSKLPRIAAVLQLDAKELCAKALAEFHPLFYNTLFVHEVAPANIQPTSIV